MEVKEKKNVKITLNVVSASLLFTEGQSQVNAQCHLSDTNLGSTPNTPENFTSTVYTTKKVTWDGATKENGYSIAITSIVYEDKGTDVNFFDSNRLNGTGGKNSQVKDKEVKDDDKLDGKTDIYTINFLVYNGNTPSGPLHIDPKLRGNA